MFAFANNGQELVQTNYWGSEQAPKSFIFLSWNAGAARLLLPKKMESALRDMKTAKYVIISRSSWHEKDREAFELLFENNSDRPYSLHIGAEQTDRLAPEKNPGDGFVVTVWTQKGNQLELSDKYRVVNAIPCLDLWETH